MLKSMYCNIIIDINKRRNRKNYILKRKSENLNKIYKNKEVKKYIYIMSKKKIISMTGR
jgi:hypothetical protein